MIVNCFFHSELLGFWTLSIVRNSKYQKSQRFGNWIWFRPQMKGGTCLLCWVPKRDLTSITGSSPESSNSGYYKPSSEPFSFYSLLSLLPTDNIWTCIRIGQTALWNYPVSEDITHWRHGYGRSAVISSCCKGPWSILSTLKCQTNVIISNFAITFPVGSAIGKYAVDYPISW
jgi:hypothetical protein